MGMPTKVSCRYCGQADAELHGDGMEILHHSQECRDALKVRSDRLEQALKDCRHTANVHESEPLWREIGKIVNAALGLTHSGTTYPRSRKGHS